MAQLARQFAQSVLQREIHQKVGPNVVAIVHAVKGLAERNSKGVIWASTRAIAAIARDRDGAPLSRYQVKRGLVKARKAGLIVDWGWREIRHAGQDKDVFMRVVNCKPGPKIPNRWIEVTGRTKAFLHSAPKAGRGGKRTGAGRPPGAKDKIKRKYTPHREGPALDAWLEKRKEEAELAKRERANMRNNQSGPVDNHSGPRTKELRSSEEESLLSSKANAAASPPPQARDLKARKPPQPSTRTPGGSSPLPNFRTPGRPSPSLSGFVLKGPAPLPNASPKAPAVPVAATYSPSTGLDCGGSARPAPVNRRLLPIRPTLGIVTCARIPQPPELDPDGSKREWAARLLDAYRGAVQSRYGQKSFAFAHGDISKSKHYPKLLQAAKALTDHEIAPAAWALFSMDIWHKHNSKDRPPPINWVFMESRIDTHYGWFGSEGGNNMGNQLMYTDAHRELVARYEGMMAELRQTRAVDPSEAIDRWYPEGLYQKLIDRATREAQLLQAELRELAATGAWLWR